MSSPDESEHGTARAAMRLGGRRALRRTTLVLMSTALLLATTEAGLQLLAWYGRTAHESRAGAAGDAGRVVLCVGDSHTYGAGVDAAESYPAQLQSRLDEALPGARIHVVNRGVPGVNTAFVAQRLESQLLELAPDVVIVWAGINNRWNSIGYEDDRSSGWATRASAWLLRSKLYRLARVLWMDADMKDPVAGGRNEQTGARHWTPEDLRRELTRQRESPIPKVEFTARLRDDMHVLWRTAWAREIPIVFVSYPLRSFGEVNATITLTALELGAPLIQTEKVYFTEIQHGATRKDLIVNAAGPHPTGRLYAAVVDELLPVVTKLLSAPAAP